MSLDYARPILEDAVKALRLARVYIVASGWTQGYHARDENGASTRPGGMLARRFSVDGALVRALTVGLGMRSRGRRPVTVHRVALAALELHTAPNDGVPYHNDNVLRTYDEAVGWIDRAVETLEKRIESA